MVINNTDIPAELSYNIQMIKTNALTNQDELIEQYKLIDVITNNIDNNTHKINKLQNYYKQYFKNYYFDT